MFLHSILLEKTRSSHFVSGNDVECDHFFRKKGIISKNRCNKLKNDFVLLKEFFQFTNNKLQFFIIY